MIELYFDLVRSHGDKADIYTAECEIWKLEHHNYPTCDGCPSQLGCTKAVQIALVDMIPLIYHPKDYDDFVKMRNRMDKLVYDILNAKTLEEVKTIPVI